MTSSEMLGSTKRSPMQTEMPDVSVVQLTEQDLAEVKELFVKNIEHTAGEINSDEFLYEQIIKDISDNESKNRRLGIRFKDKLVGYISLVPSEISFDPDDVEVAYFIDKDHVGKGIARAAVGAVVKYEDDQGHNVIATVNPRNQASLNLLKKLGFHEDHIDDDSRQVLARRALITQDMAEQFGLYK